MITADGMSRHHLTRSNVRKLRPLVHRCNTVIHPHTGEQLEYKHLIRGPHKTTWTNAFANELGRLASGVGTRIPKGTNTIQFIHVSQIPHNTRPTYGHLVTTVRPNKTENHRVRLTVGGNLIHYPGNISTPMDDITTIKILLNSVISTQKAQFITADIKDFHLQSVMSKPEYMHLPYAIIPNEITSQYNLQRLVHNNRIYIKILKGMYGLPQSGMLAYEQLCTHLSLYQYQPVSNIPGIFRHISNSIFFVLVGDDFGIKFTDISHAKHLLRALKSKYEISTDWSGSKYCGLHINWDYTNKHVDISMPKYIHNTLIKYQHPKSPHPHTLTTSIYTSNIWKTITNDSPKKLTTHTSLI